MSGWKILALKLGSNIWLELLKAFIKRKKTIALITKLKNEANEIVLVGGIRVIEFLNHN